MRRIIPVAALAFVFAGCAMPLHHWNFPPGRTQQDFSRDHRLCNLEAQMTVRPAFPGRIDRHYVECLTALGYIETGRTEPQAMIPAAPTPRSRGADSNFAPTEK